MSIELQHITKIFGEFTALHDVSVTVPSGELVALLGPSGSGKTTLLRIIAGLEVPDHGTVLFNGRDATEHSARDRRVGGPLRSISAYLMKHPPTQITDDLARDLVEKFIRGEIDH